MEIWKSVDITWDVLWTPKDVLVFLSKAPTVLVVCRSQRSSKSHIFRVRDSRGDYVILGIH